MGSDYNFGVEIEAIVEPHNRKKPVRESTKTTLDVWYGKLASAMRHGKEPDYLPLKAEISLNRSYKRQNDRNLQWWITRDGSLTRPTWPEHPGVPLEAVSPKLSTSTRWEDEIEAFWRAMRAVFHMPRMSTRCGSHVHVSPDAGRFSLSELKAIAFAVVWYNDQVEACLHSSRKGADANYCRPNIKHSRRLQGLDMPEITSIINDVSDEVDLVNVIQGWAQNDRSTLWNFQNVAGQLSSGTVEFRGGRCLRGPVKTKRWIAFAIAFITLAIKEFPLPLRSWYSRTPTKQFWDKIREAASDHWMKDYLPETYEIMSDFSRQAINEDETEANPGIIEVGDDSNGVYISQSACTSMESIPGIEDY